MVKLSIIIITRNRAELLKECLESVSMQSKKPYEIIVVDNDSDDETPHMVKTMAKKYSAKSSKLNIKYVLEKKIGIPIARNTGLKNATGDIITFLDDDCLASSNWVSGIMKAHESNIDAVYGLIMPYGKNILAGFAQSLESYPDNTVKDYRSSMINNASFKKISIGNIKFDTRLNIGEDVKFNYDLNKMHIKTLFTPRIVVKHRYRDTIAGLFKQQYRFGRHRPRLMRIANDYPFDKSYYIIYILKRIATPFFDPWLRFAYAIRHNRKWSISYLFLGYMQQLAYWAGFFVGLFRI
jgi:glycosyltransferase involved in cell wall biosynthesis